MKDNQGHFIGIDPGIEGAIVTIDSYGSIISKHRMPLHIYRREIDIACVAEIIIQLADDRRDKLFVCLEKNHGRYPQNLASASKIVWNNAPIWGLLVGLRIPHKLVKPQEWQREFYRSIGDTVAPRGTSPDGLTKLKSILAAQQRWPGESFQFVDTKAKPGKANHNITDAALMAEYARRQLLGGRFG